MSGGFPGSTRSLNIALTYNARRDTPTSSKKDTPPDDFYAEWDSPATIESVRAALAARHAVTRIEADENAFRKFRKLRPDLVFNIAEGLHGSAREGVIPSMLEMLGLPYTGSNPTTLNITLHKARAKEVLAYHGVPVPGHVILASPPRKAPEFGFPAVVKPLHEGSSKGLRDSGLVRGMPALRREIRRIVSDYDQPALVEPFLPGREFTVALLGNPPDLQILPPVEIRFDTLPEGANPVYSYEAKWIWDVPDKPLEIFECPARVSPSLRRRIEKVCRRAFEVLECRDWSRIDVRLDADGEPNVLEVNPLPGILPNPEENSCFPKAARAVGLTYADVIHRVVEAACRRWKIPLLEEEPVPAR